MVQRRSLLKVAAAGGIATLVPWSRLTGSTAAQATEVAEPAHSAPFAHPMPLPAVLRPARRTRTSDLYEIRMRQTRAELVKGLSTPVRTYGGTFPGPTVNAWRGREVVIRQINELDVPTAVHLHGAHVLSEHDGLPMDTIAPGGERTYHYPNEQHAASLWYHDHAHHLEAENVYRGLAGLYLIRDPREELLPLPSGTHDIPLVIRDARVEADGSLVYTRPTDCPHMLVNGKERPYTEVAARKYRLRIYNTCVNRYVRLRFADNTPFTVIGTDGGLLESPVQAEDLLMLGGERVEVVVDFSRHRPGTSVVLENTAALATERPEVLRFDVTRTAVDLSYVPRRLTWRQPLPRPTVERSFELRTFPEMTINGRLYDPNRTDVTARLGTTELWTVTNAEAPVPAGRPDFHLWHSFHTHLTYFRVVERNGKPADSRDAGLKDTVTLAPGETVKIKMTWGPYAGQYLYHCHQLGHSSGGQMGRIDVVD
ncbi:multicopper oxidase family protein [Streptomyces sp. NPDC058326]|uniref:multicopper oxidase family protein n=1 Tax=Streptomyces sp. NPDC058326 TaxID=3346447 RepID=UPI0036E12F52